MTAEPRRQIAFYGKGGIGKSTVVANLSAHLHSEGFKVLQIGCDPKHDSSRPFLGGQPPITIIDLLRRDRTTPPRATDYLMETSSGVHCIEVGGPEPGVGCAGRGILKMFELLEADSVLSAGYEVVLYDVLGDVVCGGFAAPMRSGHAREICIVVSGEFMAIYAANNICRGVANYARRRDVRLAGLVLNSRNVPREREVVEAFARRVNTRVLASVPRDESVSRAELDRQTVVGKFPESPPAAALRTLADNLMDNPPLTIPTPLSDSELERLFFSEVYEV